MWKLNCLQGTEMCTSRGKLPGFINKHNLFISKKKYNYVEEYSCLISNILGKQLYCEGISEGGERASWNQLKLHCLPLL